ncbi:hypothetical protein VCUG_01475 [Vavraia culicis subsp. floridensis]|uniref:Uncharacterized protein n=1 Tax=Vavraia culicis (isolate floridensis) TaxID=948595 RepID=L2GVB0_VAVCU|nr:uncharacterized protein VCUG_01475 [Vavraia culicis subsp. floridensis]ELA47030.1 hypothetical protein VCUG_01475 [Vavraia culicis subsp. floridensis]
MHFFVQIDKGQKLLFHTSNSSTYSNVYAIDTSMAMEDVFIDADSILYGYSHGTLYKVTDSIIPLYYDIRFISLSSPIFLVANDHLVLMKSDTNFQVIKRVPATIKGLKSCSNDYLFWEDRKMYFGDRAINIDFTIKELQLFNGVVFILSAENKFYTLKGDLPEEIIDLESLVVVDMCINKYLPVIAFLTDDSIYILDVGNKKIVKVIESYGGQNIIFKNKRELFIISDKVIEYHLGKDVVGVVLEGSSGSKFRCFELDSEIKFFENDTFREEVRTKLIENKIESKRMIFELMNEVEELRRKISKS